jgi:phosphoglycolate phosphatase-like HAD superfamily hydrolase
MSHPGRAVVFDLDGTLVDTMTLVPQAYADTISTLGGPAITPDEVVAAWHLGPTSVVLAHFLGRSTGHDDLECYYRHLDRAATAARPFPGVVAMVDGLAAAGYRLAVFTSATRRAATTLLERSGLSARFPVVVAGDQVAAPKPAPHGLHMVCGHLAVPVGRAAYVGDAEVDLRCAAAAGAVGIHAGWGSRQRFTGDHHVAAAPGEVVGLVAGLG